MSTNKVPAKSRNPNLTGGSRKGVPNKVTADLKEMILGALAAAGGAQYLAAKAASHPAAFMTLVGKVLPLQVTGAGEGDAPLTITVRYVDAPKRD